MHKKIPIINDTFDIITFRSIVVRSWFIGVVILLLSVFGALLKIRYTAPLYEAKSILQIEENNKTSQVLQLGNLYEDSKKLSKTIALMRSKEFLKRIFLKLPLDIRYFIKGAFLSDEMYKTSNYTVDYEVTNGMFYGLPIFITFIDEYKVKVEYESNDKEFVLDGEIGRWFDIGGMRMKVMLNDYESIKRMYENEKQNDYYFVIYNEDQIYDMHSNMLIINLLSSQSNSISISYNSHNTQQAADVVNAIAQEFQVFEIEKKRESVANILNFIESQLQNVYQVLDTTETRLQIFRKENHISLESSFSSSIPIFTAKIEEFENRVNSIEIELITLRAIKDQLGSQDQFNIYEIVSSLSGTNSEKFLVSVLNNLQQLLNQRNHLLSNITENNMRVKIIDKQIKNQKEMIRDFIDYNIKRVVERQNEYKKKVKEYESRLFEDSSFDKLEYARLQRLQSINEGFYNQLIQKKAEYLISQAGYVTQNVILEKASANLSSIAPNKKQIITGWAIIGLFIYLVYIFSRYLLFNEITSIATIQNYTKIPVIGMIPSYESHVPVSQLLVNARPNSMFTESFRNLRSNLQFLSPGAGSNIITVTSTISGEGKTFVAINIAGIQAISGKRTIILDMDLRKPRLHLGFNTSNEKGMSTILIGKHNYKDCVCKSEQENLDFITAGPVPPNPAELVFSQRMDDLLEELEESYDIIIIDTPPIGIVTDALVNLQRANYPIYVLKSNLSKRNFMENINSLVLDKKLASMSIVFNGVDSAKRRYGYGYGYGYYSDDSDTDSRSFFRRIFSMKS